jgi:predicted TPR repeat methyltransferase
MPEPAPSLNAAYGLSSPEDNLALYRDWAATYDQTFAAAMDYIMPHHVSMSYVEAGGIGPVLDVGAGTGLVAAALSALGVAPIDGTDFSPEMLAVAAAKGIYQRLFPGDITARLDLPDGHYAGVVSSGTFTLGHVGPAALDEVLRITRPGGLVVMSVNVKHYEQAGFAAKFAALGPQIAGLSLDEKPFYGPGASGDHATDRGYVVGFRRTSRLSGG